MKKRGKVWIPGRSKGPISFEIDSGGEGLSVATLGTIFAIFLSILSFAFTVIQTSHTERPYLDVGAYEDTQDVFVRIANDGPGTAIIKEVEISYAGKRPGKFEDLHDQIRQHAKFKSDVWFSDFGGPGSYFPSGGHKDVITMKGLTDRPSAWKLIRQELKVRITYCSLSDECWQACLNTDDKQCPTAGI